jgi:hypothetical protein
MMNQRIDALGSGFRIGSQIGLAIEERVRVGAAVFKAAVF